MALASNDLQSHLNTVVEASWINRGYAFLVTSPLNRAYLLVLRERVSACSRTHATSSGNACLEIRDERFDVNQRDGCYRILRGDSIS